MIKNCVDVSKETSVEIIKFNTVELKKNLGFNGAETNYRIACKLGILLMNSNCFAIFFSNILVMSVQISI